MGNRLRHVTAGRAAWVLAFGVVLAAVFSGGASLSRVPAQAATPPGPVTLSVPAGGVGTVSTSWMGTAPPGTNALAIRCVDFTGTPLDNQSDTFLLQVNGVSDAFYLTHRVQLIVRITWTPISPGNCDTNDLGLTTYLRDANGNLTRFQDSHQLGSSFEQVIYSNPPAATGQSIESPPQPVAYHVNTCADNNAPAQNYQGTATLISRLITSSSNVTAGAQTFNNYDFPLTYQTRDRLMRPNAGEPNIDANWVSGNTLYMSGTQITRITWNDTKSPPPATFTDVTPLGQAQVNEDAILTTDHVTNRTQAAGLLIAGSNISFSDNDGTSWTQGGSPAPHSPDHETINGGPYHQPPPLGTGVVYKDAVYYCSQNIVQAAGAFCSRSDTGGLSWNVSTLVFAGTDCGAIHGHVKIGSDGTVYLPQKACGGGQGMGVSSDNGATWSIARVPDSSTVGLSSSDPSVAPAPDGKTVYYAYQDGFGNPEVAVSSDHGRDGSWSPSTNVGAPFAIKNTKFPQMVVGDTDRAAVAFLGTTTAGDDQSSSFTGTWYQFVAFTYDRGKTWTTVNATPNDPVQRGCVWLQGGSNPCRNMLDFNEITVDGHGRVEAAYTDGCTKACETTNTINASGCNGSEGASYTSTPTCTYGRLSAVVRQQCGFGLFAAFDAETAQRCGGGGGGGGGGGCHPADASGTFAGPQGSQPSFQSDEDSCEDHDVDSEQMKDPGSGEDFHSTQIQSKRFDDSIGTATITGVGISNGLPVTFLIVEQAATATTPAFYSISLSDGYALAGNLLAGGIQLQ
jgi:hypothetical protein